jgi:hypothetical protein
VGFRWMYACLYAWMDASPSPSPSPPFLLSFLPPSLPTDRCCAATHTHSHTHTHTQRLERLKSKLKEIGHPKRAPFHPHATTTSNLPYTQPYHQQQRQQYLPGGQGQGQGQLRRGESDSSGGSLASALGACVECVWIHCVHRSIYLGGSWGLPVIPRPHPVASVHSPQQQTREPSTPNKPNQTTIHSIP